MRVAAFITATIFFVILSYSPESRAAEVMCAREGDIAEFYLDGQIIAGDYEKLVSCWNKVSQPNEETQRLLDRLNKEQPGRFVFPPIDFGYLVVSSEGGDVNEAMRIGRFVRQKKMWVAVRPSDINGICLSSCIYILAAGVGKLPLGMIGIHRPYFPSRPNLEISEAIKSVLNESVEYFIEMNIPPSLAEDMFSIPPEEIKVLDDALLRKYRLDQSDMAYSEENDLRMAEYYGITRQEYMRRKRLADTYYKECISDLKPDERNLDGWSGCATRAYKRAGLGR